MHNFFITGLPRSRTSWLANYFTTGISYCYHELSNEGTYLAIKEKLMSRPEEYVGVSDCLLPYYFDDIMECSELYRLVIIKRDPEDVFRSLRKWMGNEFFAANASKILNELIEKTNIMSKKYDCLIVSFDDLNKRETIEKLWYYCVPNALFDEERFEMLDRFSIDPVYKKHKSFSNKEKIEMIIGG